jgi:hypothetical protein
LETFLAKMRSNANQFNAPRSTDMSNGTALSLAEAAKAVGMVKSSILRAVKSGRISGTRDEHGQWLIEPVELFRVFKPVAEQRRAADAEQQAAAVEMVRLNEQVIALQAMCAEVRARLADTIAQRDRWQQIAERMSLTHESAQAPQAEQGNSTRRPWWRRLAG